MREAQERGAERRWRPSSRRPGLKTFIALFRGINVVGRNKLPMEQLVSILESLGLKDVETYIQSGNAVFRSKASDATRLATKVRSQTEPSATGTRMAAPCSLPASSG